MSSSRVLLAAFVLLAATPSVAMAQPQRDAYARGAAAVESGRMEDAYGHFVTAVEQARAARDTPVEVRARRVLAQIEYNRGARFAWLRQPERALPYFENGIALDPDYARNYLGLGLALDRLGRRDESVLTLRMAAAAAERRGDVDLRDTAERTLRTLAYDRIAPFVDTVPSTAAAATIVLAELDALDAALPPDTRGARYRADAFLALRRYTEAIDVTTAALREYRGEREGAAGLYFARAEAYLALGDRVKAWEAYQGALYGLYRTRADARIRSLR